MSRSRHTQVLVPLALCALVTAVTGLGMGDVTLGAPSSSTVNPAFLPLGDGKVTTSGPKRGYVYSCGSGLRAAGGAAGGPPGGGGAQVEGPWIHGDGTFDLTAKATVDGSVHWPDAKLQRDGDEAAARLQRQRPARAGDDRRISGQVERRRLPVRPQSQLDPRAERPLLAAPPPEARRRRPSCLSMGPIGIAKNGVAIFNALDAGDRDAVAHEVQDSCGGHPQQSGVYHYHDIPSCLTRGESKHRASGLVGWALDGYPIYGPRGHGGKLLTDGDLDACHGQTSKVFYEGRWQRIYHYNATLEYPYTLACFHGTPRA